jgi:replicative DNA helicase
MVNKKTDYLVEQIQNLDDEAFIEVVDKVATRSANTEIKRNDDIVHVKDLGGELDEVLAERGKLKGFSTGYTTLDEKMGGLEKGSVILFGGETSNGKSALATNIAVNLGKKGVSVLYISLEMTRKQMLDRLDYMTEGHALEVNLSFQKTFSLDYKDLEPLIKKATATAGVEVVVLDYLQYLGRGMSLDEVARMSKTVKALALTYNLAFMVIVSLRKAGGDVKSKRKWTDIEIEDLMGTAAIGYDADTAIVVSRKDPENEFQKDHIYVKVLKTRNTELNWNNRIVELDWSRTRITEEWTVSNSSAFPNARKNNLVESTPPDWIHA